MIRHVFLWRAAAATDPAEVVSILNELPAHVPGILSWGIGSFLEDFGKPQIAWDYGLTCEFETPEELHTYLTHPYHQDVIKRLEPLISERAICHFEVPKAGRS